MRRVSVPGLLALSAVACLHGPEAFARQARGGIVVPASAHVCVAVHVDQRIWPRPLDANSAQIFSGYLMPEVRRLYEQRAGLDRMPGTQNEARFVTNENGTNPSCQDRRTDVFIDVRYGPRRDGTPFVMSYRIARGTAVRTGRIDFDVAREIRAGRIWGYSVRRTIEVIIGEDMPRRAPMIADQLIVRAALNHPRR
jgi:hypothetical protein